MKTSKLFIILESMYVYGTFHPMDLPNGHTLQKGKPKGDEFYFYSSDDQRHLFSNDIEWVVLDYVNKKELIELPVYFEWKIEWPNDLMVDPVLSQAYPGILVVKEKNKFVESLQKEAEKRCSVKLVINSSYYGKTIDFSLSRYADIPGFKGISFEWEQVNIRGNTLQEALERYDEKLEKLFHSIDEMKIHHPKLCTMCQGHGKTYIEPKTADNEEMMKTFDKLIKSVPDNGRTISDRQFLQKQLREVYNQVSDYFAMPYHDHSQILVLEVDDEGIPF